MKKRIDFSQSAAFVAPVVDGLAPVLVDELDGAGGVLVLVLLVAALAVDVVADGFLGLFPARELELGVDVADITKSGGGSKVIVGFVKDRIG